MIVLSQVYYKVSNSWTAYKSYRQYLIKAPTLLPGLNLKFKCPLPTSVTDKDALAFGAAEISNSFLCHLVLVIPLKTHFSRYISQFLLPELANIPDRELVCLAIKMMNNCGCHGVQVGGKKAVGFRKSSCKKGKIEYLRGKYVPLFTSSIDVVNI